MEAFQKDSFFMQNLDRENSSFYLVFEIKKKDSRNPSLPYLLILPGKIRIRPEGMFRQRNIRVETRKQML